MFFSGRVIANFMLKASNCCYSGNKTYTR